MRYYSTLLVLLLNLGWAGNSLGQSSADITVNEFMYDPPSGSSEYVELYNHSQNPIDIQGWTLSDNRGTKEQITASSFTVPADSFVVLAPDNSLNSTTEYSDIALIDMGSSFPALNNSGDAIVVHDASDALVDSVDYAPGWGGEEVALERRSFTTDSNYPQNWGNAPDSFGSPGNPNNIPDDTTPPSLESLVVQNNTQITLHFSEMLNQPSAENTSNYSLAAGPAISGATFSNPDSVSLQLASNLQNNISYDLSINGVVDIFDNSAVIDTSFTYYEISSADSGDVAINEFMPSPPSGSSEYVEIYNHSNKSLDLQDWTLSDSRGNQSVITFNQFIVPPDSFIVIAPNGNLTSSHPNIAIVDMGSRFPSLNNSGDEITLRDGSGELLDSFAYRTNWVQSEVALERRSIDVASNYHNNWGAAPNGFGTPGSQNEIEPDAQPPSLESLTIQNASTIAITFSEQINQENAKNANNYTFQNGPDILSPTYASPDSVFLQLASDLQNAASYSLSVMNVADIFGNTTPIDTSFTYYNPSPVDSGDVAINEFMAAPPSNSSEYVEIYNHSDKSLDLQNWTLSDSRGTNAKITSSQFIVPPDSFAVIAPDITLKSNYPDIPLVIMGNFPSLNNGGDQITMRDGSGTLLDSLEYTSTWGNEEIALERRSIDVSSRYQSNWGDAPNGFGTPGRLNEIKPDTKPPTVESLTIQNSSTIALVFSEQLNQTIAENGSNYSLESGPAISTAALTAPDSLLLHLHNKLQNATDYTLSVEGTTDIFGNAIPPTDTTFTYYEVSPVDSGDVFINEFNFTPASGSTEYVEIYNATSKSFNLQNWTISDNRDNKATITSSQFIVPPDSFVVVAPDNTLLTSYPDIALVSFNDFPALNNSGDDIKIHSADGTLLDSLRYTSSWGGDEVALERRTVDVSGIFSENWNPSPNGFGTPGSANEVSVDNTPPFFEELNAVDATTLQLVFSERITSGSTDIQNYEIFPTRNIQLISARNDSVTLFLGQELTSEQTYEVTASDISDIFGNTLSGATKEIEFLRIDQAKPGDIVINEILYNPGSGGKADFIELYNTTDKNFELGNWLIGDASRETSIPQNVQLRAGSYLVLTGSDRFASSLNNAIDVDDFPSLNNNIPDAIYLTTNSGKTIDSLRYDQSWGGSSAGTSLERIDPQAASNDASNWMTNSASNGSSAGAQNVSFQEDTNPPEVIFAKVRPSGNIEVRFSEFITLAGDVQFLADGQPLQVVQFDSTSANVIILSDGPSKSSTANSTTITVRNLSDVKGNTTSSSEITVAQPLEPADVVINEIMFNPLDEPDDNRPDQGEYIELRNTQDYPISLEGLYLHDAPDEDGNVRELQPVSTTAKWVSPQRQVLIHADENPSFEDTKVANFFDLTSSNMRSVMRVNRSSLSLASSGDAIYIADSTGATIDSVYYGEKWHNPNIIDTRGMALERVAPGGPSDNNSNWGSSVNEKGGTPNSENSIYQENAEKSSGTGISFNPNPFSPDNDGYEDNLFINYSLEQQDYLIDVHIYDRYGRLVRELADGKQAGFEGQLIWDGRKDDGSRNRIGIYIVVFEAYDSATGSDKTFKKTVVLARKLN